MEREQKILLTPGPLCTTAHVKEAMLVDLGTRDQEYTNLCDDVATKLLQIAQVSKEEFALVFLQGSGTYGVESVLTSTIGTDDKLLIIANGAYGQRMAQIAQKAHIKYELHEYSMLEALDMDTIEPLLQRDDVTHVSFIHHETTAGVLNDAQTIAKLAKLHHKVVIVDAMSSFGGIPICLDHIDYLVTSSNKCLHGVPGIAIIFARIAHLQTCANYACSLSLDLYEQYEAFRKGNGFRFTSPTHVMLALQMAIDEFLAAGGVMKRNERYRFLQSEITACMTSLGFPTLLKEEDQAPIITTFLIPDGFDFQAFYDAMKLQGILLYSGKLPSVQAFRIGNIGAITDQDLAKFKHAVVAYCKGVL